MRPGLLLTAFLAASPVLARSPDEPLLEAAIVKTRASREDLDVRPGRWETRLSLEPVEAVLKDPLSAANYARELSDELSSVGGPAGLLETAARALTSGAPIPSASLSATPSLTGLERLGLPKDASDMILQIAITLEESRAFARRAADSIPPEARKRAVSEILGLLASPESSRPDPAAYDDLNRFDLPSMLEAARRLATTAETAVSSLERASTVKLKRRTWRLPSGDVVLSGPGDDTYDEEFLRRTALLIDLGGDNRYKGPAAAAGEGEVRLIIDLGRDVTVESSSSAASGVLGVGLMYLTNPKGRKVLRAGDVSWGAGILGAGVLRLAGPASVTGGSLSQGAGAAGAGILWAAGGSTFTARTAAQAFGFTRGAGFMVLRGDGSRLGCLDEPDPREAKASVSLCQGVGYGPRAFAAGGLGLALVAGDGNDLKAGYFAQGSGYWHGLGALVVRGNGNRLKARRYAQGAGVHAAVGLLSVQGDGNRLVNWGAGPAIGWDYGVGFLGIRGSSNTAKADWGAGRGDANGHGLAVVNGAGNRLVLPEFGSAYMRRGAPSYGLAVLRGTDNRIRFRAAFQGPLDFRLGPWGVLDAGEGSFLDPSLELPTEEWREVPRNEAAGKEKGRLERLYREAASMPLSERLSRLLFIASAFSLDRGWPAKARRDLLSLAPGELPALMGLVSPERFDELSWLRPIIASYPASIQHAAAKAKGSSGLLKAVLLGQLRYATIGAGTPPLLQALGDLDWRVRAAAAGGLGALYGRDGGDEPGRRWLLEAAAALNEENMLKAAGRQRPAELLSALALDPSCTPEEKAAFMDTVAVPSDPVGQESLKVFWNILSRRSPEERRGRLRPELRRQVDDSPPVRQALRKALEETDRDVVVAALTALGQIGSKEDAPVLARFLSHGSGVVRESAASALGRLGDMGMEALSAAQKSRDPRTRALAAIGAAQSWNEAGGVLLERALKDKDASVRAVAASSVNIVQGSAKPGLTNFKAMLTSLSEKDPSFSVRAAATAALGSVP